MGATVAANRVSLKLKFVRDDELFCFNDAYIRFHITIRNGVSGFKFHTHFFQTHKILTNPLDFTNFNS